MAEVASAYVSLIPSAKGFASGTTKIADQAGKDAGKRFGLSFKSMVAGAGGLLAGGAVVGFFKDAVGQASDLSESASKVGVVFGKQAKEILKASETSATAMGLSKSAYLDATGTLGNLLVSLDIAPKKSAKLSKSMVKLAGDMASFNNTSPEDALLALKSGLTGETEPLKRYGVNMNDATLHAEALKLGLIKTIKDGLTPQTKALAAQSLIMAQTKTAQGDFARTSGGLANQQRIAAAEVSNLKSTIGSSLLPVVTDVTKRLNADVIPAVSDFVKEMQNGTGAGGELVADLKQIVNVGKGVVGFFTGLPGPVKKYGIEVLVAAVAVGKLNSGLSFISGGLGRYVTAITTAETRSAKFSAGLQGLGGVLRNVAGAGGMLLVADGAKKAGTGMGILEGAAGGALSGAALGAFGGPPGAAIGAAIGGLAGAALTLGHNTEAAGRNAKVSIPSWKEYATTLDGVSAKTTKATRDMVYQRLESSGLLEATRKLGLSDREAVSAVMGNQRARTDMARALRNNNTLTDNQRSALEKETGALGASRLAQLKKNVALAANKEELQKARTALRNFMAEPASKRVAITGVEGAKAQLRSLQTAIRQVWGAAKDANVAGSGGLGVLLNPGARAMGGPVTAGQPYIVGEKRPELFVPNTSGRIIPQVPTSLGASSVDAEQASYRAMTRALADSGTIIMPKSNLSALDLMVGVA